MFLMVQPICLCEQPFSYSQDAQPQFWHLLGGIAYCSDQRKLENSGSHNLVASSKAGACSPTDRYMVLVQLLTHVIMRKEAVPSLVLQYAPCTMILLLPWYAICDSREMDPVICTKAWAKCCCQHLTSTKPCKLSLDKGRLNCDIFYGGINSELWHPSSMQCVQPPNFALTYPKWDAVCAAVVHMFKQSTTQDWGRLLYFNQRPPDMCFGIAKSSTISLRIPAVFVWLIPTYAIIHIAGAQCMCLCSAPCLFGKWWSNRDLVYTIQEWTFYKNHVLEHATVGNIPSPGKLQKTMQTLNILVWWQFRA